MRFEGVYLPITTPFGSDGELDASALTANVRRWSETRIAGVLVAGSTGEAALLDDAEALEAVRVAREALPADRTLIAGTGRQSTRAAIRAARAAAAAGAGAVLVYPPYYFRGQMTPEALRLHFWEVADASPVPVLLYHVPKFVPVDLAPDLVGELMRHGNIVGIKDSSGDMQNLGALCEVCGDDADVLVGAGTHLYSGLEIGARGGIIAVGLLAAGAATELYDAFRAGRAVEAGRLQERIGPLHRAVVAGTGVPGVKYGLDELGFIGGPPRPPLLPPDEAGRTAVRRALQAAGLLQAAETGGS
ncbi:MAG: dihydrodipicolinate synthase family protein [Gemmatimonadales bacterium]|jgi:4-hydroxy-2-oxoglutarate aldolase